LLQGQLGFKCSSFAEYKRPEPALQGFTGFINYMNICSNGTGASSACDCDLGVGAWAVSSTRHAKVDLVAPFSNEDYRVITTVENATGSKQNIFFFFSTFAWPVWLAIVGLLAFHVLVTALDQKFVPLDTAERAASYENGNWIHRTKAWLLKSALLYRVRHAFFNSAYHLLGQAPHFFSETKKGTKEKMLGMIALFMGVFLITVYQASITVQVIQSSPSPDFVSIRDFESCRIPANRVAFLNNGASQEFWRNAIERTR
jgi:hypothetical protein